MSKETSQNTDTERTDTHAVIFSYYSGEPITAAEARAYKEVADEHAAIVSEYCTEGQDCAQPEYATEIPNNVINLFNN